MAEVSKKFTLVKFKKMPIESMTSDTECVPTSWIKCYFDDVNVGVAFPPEMTSTNKSLMKTGKDPIQKWGVHPATVVCQLDTYKQWESILSPASAAAAVRAPQSPLVQQLENLAISTPANSKTPGTPKNLQKVLNTPDETTAETVPSNTAIQVDEELLQELYRTWEHMNSLMEKIFKPENRPN